MANSQSDHPIAFCGSDPSATDAVFVHANGFCKEMWLPVVEALVSDPPFKWTLVDQRGHGESTPHPGPFRWHELALDLLDLIPPDAGVVGIGHSSGGAALARAEALRPGTFSRLVLIEPIISPGPYERRDTLLAAGAEKRRRSFATPEEALERFGSGPFGRWDRRVLELYVSHGFVEVDGQCVLRCKPEVEAEFYREGSNTDTWDRLGDVTCHVTVVAGSQSDSHQQPYLDLLAKQFSDANLVVLEGLGHLAPMESPSRVAEVIGTIG